MLKEVSVVVTALTVFAAGLADRAEAKRGRGIATYTKGGLPNIQAQSAAVVDLNSGEELIAKNADEERPIASISKLMATLVVLDRKLDLDGETVMTDSDRQIASGGARSRLPVGLAFTNRDLLHAALMASDNRAVPALGRAVGLDPTGLVAAMNAKAKDLGMQHTRFEDPVGLSANNVSTARELVMLLRAVAKNELIAEITEKPTYQAHPVGKPRWIIDYVNTDVLARGKRWEVITGKTGYTDIALYCLAIAVKMNPEGLGPRPVAMVFLGAVGKMTRFGDFGRVAQWLIERKWGKGAGL
jgi:D-alanyl-D-alanine endopeptidase (penicillin-binding protein 7)